MTGGDNGAEESATFREAMRDLGVKQRQDDGRHRPPPAPPVIKPRADSIAPRPGRPRADRGVLVDTTDGGEGESVAFARGGVQKTMVRKLKRGDCRPAAVLDLHGHTAAEAEDAIDRFLARAGGRGLTEVLVIHGKGLRSGPVGGVLRGVTCERLKRHPAVLAFCSAQPRDGGSGAMYVLLRAGRAGRGRRR